MTSQLDQVKSQIQDQLVSSGNYDDISRQLKVQLYESGWFDQVQKLAVSELGGGNENFDHLYQAIKPSAEELVPQHVRDEITEKIRRYVEEIVQ
ncbi:hypothetical protein DIURU_001040 [Diutina rugosa]|uniref:Transcription and mRNA export factor SUS1 n=1 Tax=Diutina rugosa TaxID=5481 RepID=A0A642UVF7_DIURU|nr:uncharacterized protein DIURU_001040 [Diutina rugosa]KAA8906462.1 hypothetical protein DIURU_001040 [Diutina rugosa]